MLSGFLNTITWNNKIIFPLPKVYYHLLLHFYMYNLCRLSKNVPMPQILLQRSSVHSMSTFHTANLLIRHNCVSQLTCMIPIWPYAMLMSLLLASLSLLASLGFLSIILLSAFS